MRKFWASFFCVFVILSLLNSVGVGEDIQWGFLLLENSGYNNINSYAYVRSNVNLDIHNWAKKSFYMIYDYCDPSHNGCLCGNFDYIEEFEFNAPQDMTIFSVKPKYYLTNTGHNENSYYFLVNISIFNFNSGKWKSIYKDNSIGGGFRDERAIEYMKPELINDGKIRLKIEISSRDDLSSGYCSSWTLFKYPNGTSFRATFLFEKIIYEYSTISILPPSLSNLPDRNINQDTKPPAKWIDLWDYVSDEDRSKEKLKFFIETQSNSSLINCWIDVNRYVTCGMPAKRQSGHSDITVKVADSGGLSDTDTFRVNVLPPTLTILIIPFDWNGSYESYSKKVDEIASYFLERIPLSNCSGQLKLLKVKENEDYGWFYWDDWRCRTLGTRIPFTHCHFGALKRIYNCGEKYAKSKDEKYDFVIGISDNDIAPENCDYSVAGWSDGKGNLPSVIAETTTPGIVTHELGHEFGLSDQYCRCDGTSSEKFCGTRVNYSSLRFELGCNPNPGGGCCWYDYDDEVYPGCYMWCLGNFDIFGEDRDNDTFLDYGQRTIMSNRILHGESGHYDEYEFSHLEELPELQCKIEQTKTMSVMQSFAESQTKSNFSLALMLNIDKNDNVTLLGLNFTEFEFFETKSSGDYSLKILNQDNNTLYQKNFSVNFIIFSDPPTFVNESIIFETVKYQDSMKKLVLYHNNSLIFSHDIPSFCNSNGICEESENYLSCSDCQSYAVDGICNREMGDGCDFDCIEGLDTDCADLTILNVSLGENLIERKETEIKMNISNLGIRNVIFEIGLFSDNILETNISVNFSGNFSDTREFNWTPQKGCARDLIFSLDFTNVINEINEANNELKIENVTIGLQGDVLIDFKIDIFDLAAVGLAYGSQPGNTNWNPDADVTGDGIINIFDLATVGLNYGKGC